MREYIADFFSPWLGGYALWAATFIDTILRIVAIVLPLMLCVAYLTYAERRVIGAMQLRIGPNRVGPIGLLQPIADALKLLLKEVVLPIEANRFLFLIAPAISLTAALAAWAVSPFRRRSYWPMLTPACFMCWPLLRLAYTESSSPVGLPIPNTLFWVVCVQPHKLFLMKLPWVLRW